MGKINKIGPPVEHSFPDDNSNFNDNKIRSMIWERNIQHSIRKGFDDGFILPYQEVLEYCKENPNSDLDPAEIAVIVPDDHKIEFAYASEFVTPDASINVLLRTIESLDKIKEHIQWPWEKIKKWIDIQLGDLWKQRGPYPGMGSVLRSFGIDLGNLLANEINEKIESGMNHWDLLDQIFEDPQSNLPQELSSQIGRIHKKKWQKLSKERKTFLEFFILIIYIILLNYNVDRNY